MPGIIRGGKEGAGGTGRMGGNGGAGQAPQMSPETVRVFDGNIDDGSGASADAVNCKAVSTASMGQITLDMPLNEFCAQYRVGQDLFQRLGQLGFTTVGFHLEVKDAGLTDRGSTLVIFRS
ncbi:hypothetical protein B0H16DRAFT_1476016 [Mycena metata]|uniref:Uncharacterized protein n=1 Tax=Mycena metata TaxID=1033252 RepID=A0AAD7MIE1_9AGAR|nr:hypothetical protein B0H16DRAFT_1476016 [Mycena metata]